MSDWVYKVYIGKRLAAKKKSTAQALQFLAEHFMQVVEVGSAYVERHNDDPQPRVVVRVDLDNSLPPGDKE